MPLCPHGSYSPIKDYSIYLCCKSGVGIYNLTQENHSGLNISNCKYIAMYILSVTTW